MNIVSGTRAGALLFSSLGLQAGDPFIISAGSTVILDTDTPSLGPTDVSGYLKTDGQTRSLTTSQITVNSGGVFEAGTAAVPLVNTFTVNLTGAYVPLTLTTVNSFATPSNPGASRGIQVMSGGTLMMHGTPPTLWTTLNANAAASQPNLTLATSPGWLSGDPVIVAHTDFCEYGGTELFSLNSDTSGTSAVLNANLAVARWGQLQYPVDTLVSGNGMSLTQNTFSAKKATASVPILLDERARVANLRRNIVITCPNDTDWSNKGHGVVTMAMSGSVYQMSGVQIRRGGQRGALGRYPFHMHMMSWNPGTGAFIADAATSYVKKCVVWDSENRAFTCHGTTGSEWSDNTGYNVKGHAFFQEDGSEINNKFYRNAMFKTVPPNGGHTFTDPSNFATLVAGLSANRGVALPGTFVSMSGNGTTTTVNWTGHGLYAGEVISVSSASISGFNLFRVPVLAVADANHFTYLSTGSGTPTGAVFRHNNDQIKAHDSLASGHWFTNLGNDIQDNYASDMKGSALTDYVNTGLGACGVWVSLSGSPTGLSHSVVMNPNLTPIGTFKGCVAHGALERGLKFADPVGDEVGTPRSGTSGKYLEGLLATFPSTDHILWKNAGGAYLNSVGMPDYQRWTTADNDFADFIGSTDDGGLLHNGLCIGTSLNNTHTGNTLRQPYPRACFTPYHGTVRIFDMTMVNFPYAAPVFGYPGDTAHAGGVSMSGADSYDIPGIDLVTGLNTNIQLINSHYGNQAVPHQWDGQGILTQRNYGIAAVYQDLDGKYGAPGKFQMCIVPGTGLVDDYLLSGAANVVNGPLTGQVVCQTTTTRFFGMGNSDDTAMHSDTIDALGVTTGDWRWTPVSVTRQNVATGAQIGSVYSIYGPPPGIGLAVFRTWAMQAGGRFQIDFTDGNTTVAAPSSYSYLEICNANVVGDFLILGIPWSGSVAPRICWGAGMSNEPVSRLTNSGAQIFNSFASAADQTAGKAIIPNVSGASIAAVVADTSGKTYFRDTANNRVWIRYTCPPTPASNPVPGFETIYDIQYIVIKA